MTVLWSEVRIGSSWLPYGLHHLEEGGESLKQDKHMSLADAAYAGILTLSQLRVALNGNSELIDEIGGTINLTSLCAACLGGHLRVVKHLLSCGANPNIPSGQNRTPLFYAVSPQCNASSGTRCAIIRELASGKHGTKADLDQLCDDDMNTALVLAISVLKDNEVAEQLMKCGASASITFRPCRAGAKGILDSHRDRGIIRRSVVDRAISFLLLVLAFFNYKTQEMIVGRLRSGQTCLPGSQNPDSPTDPHIQLTMGDFPGTDEKASNEKKLKFVVPDPPYRMKTRFGDEIRARAKLLQADPTTDLGGPGNIERLMKLSRRRVVILCDDSKSMTLEHRHAYQIELVRRMASVATRLLPSPYARVDLRFINHDIRHSVSVAQVQKVMRSVQPTSGSSIGTSLREKVLQRFVYDVIAADPDAGTRPSMAYLRRPLLICMVTDGAPTTESTGTLLEQIVECKDYLHSRGYDPRSVLYNVIQIGEDPAATTFINTLRSAEEISDLVNCTQGRIDTQYEALWEDERKLDSWMLDILAAPLDVPQIE